MPKKFDTSIYTVHKVNGDSSKETVCVKDLSEDEAKQQLCQVYEIMQDLILTEEYVRKVGHSRYLCYNAFKEFEDWWKDNSEYKYRADNLGDPSL